MHLLSRLFNEVTSTLFPKINESAPNIIDLPVPVSPETTLNPVGNLQKTHQ